MSETLQFLAAPIVMAILLVAIHVYLGMHVLERGVIFIDIGLAQVAALGAAVSLFWVHEHDHVAGIFVSLGFCLVVAALLALLRVIEKQVSQEAIIGVTFAAASGALVLVADRLPHGVEHLKEAMVGNILFVTWQDVLVTFVVYTIVGLLHYWGFKMFWRSSLKGDAGWIWDFLFYFLFGVVITFSTRHAGVLVVFSILVVPAALARRLINGFSRQLISAWIFGVLGVGLAFCLSLSMDWPAGPALVAVLSALFFGVLFLRAGYEKVR